LETVQVHTQRVGEDRLDHVTVADGDPGRVIPEGLVVRADRLDRAGLVGEDGPTQHGAFDIAYMRLLPNMQVMAPKDENELRHMLYTALSMDGPVCLRYPRGSGVGVPLDETLRMLPVDLTSYDVVHAHLSVVSVFTTRVAKAAARAGVPVVPVAMFGTDKANPIGSKMWRPTKIRIRIGAPLDFSRYEGLEGDRFIERSIDNLGHAMLVGCGLVIRRTRTTRGRC